jgi:hypothetical protein
VLTGAVDLEHDDADAIRQLGWLLDQPAVPTPARQLTQPNPAAACR